MCTFNYAQFSCKCQLYHGNGDIEYCAATLDAYQAKDVTPSWMTKLLVPRTAGQDNTDYCNPSTGLWLLTAPEVETNKFTQVSCDNQTYVAKEVVYQARGECPYHDEYLPYLEMMKRRKEEEEKRKEDEERAKHEGWMRRAVRRVGIRE